MYVRSLSSYALCLCSLAALLAGCGGLQSGGSLPQQHVQGGDNNPAPNGKHPTGGLFNIGSVLYGTTLQGGQGNHGTLFSVTTGGNETTLHHFHGADGSNPNGSLIMKGNKLFGTTTAGGANGLGVVFKSSLGGNVTVLHSFQGGTDGAVPTAHLTQLGNLLYGTTVAGGSNNPCNEGGLNGCGTIYSVTAAVGSELVVHPFNWSDGRGPNGGLVAVNNLLYGTTGNGPPPADAGTVYSVTTSGTVTTLHAFAGGTTDGGNPTGDLLYDGGVFYGMTLDGGPMTCSEPDTCGSIYSITPSMTFATLYSFQGGTSDGFAPAWGLTNVGGTYYGVTAQGGLHGKGVFFSVTSGGTETVLYSFGGSLNDATAPYGTLLDIGGTLYGTSYYGGTNNRGTVYQITTGGAESIVYSF